jgi:nucleoside-diphosphate-sugar epimerase
MQILLTGASGFVGKAVLTTAQQRGFKIRPVYRSIDSSKGQAGGVLVPDLLCADNWPSILQDIDVVIHTVGRAHIMREELLEPLAEYRRVNVDGTLNIARKAAAAGVRRFVFISSIKVNGENTNLGQTFAADDNPAPEDAYGISKAEAEAKLKQLAQESGMEVTIIRPPLIYGQGVKGNLANLISWVRSGLPLPFGGMTNNRRSFVGLDNLVDLILLCADHPKAANQTFLISDGEDLSTTDMITKICVALGRQPCLVWVPAGLISLLARLVGKKEISKRLLGSLQVNMNKTYELLDWRPSVPVDEGLRRAVN